jgi:hypothetical protein
MSKLHPQFVTDEDGKAVSVLLPLGEYEALLEDLSDLQEALNVRDDTSIPWETIKAELDRG